MTIDPEVARVRAQQAERLLNDPLLIEIFERIEKRNMTAWLNSAPVDAEKRETLWNLVAGLKAFRSELTAEIKKAKVSADASQRERAGGDGSVGTHVPSDGPIRRSFPQ